MNSKLHTVFTFAKINTKGLFRDKVAIFFVFLFPIIFLFVFGTIFGGNNSLSFNVALLNQSDSEFAANFVKQTEDDGKLFKVDKEASTLDLAKEKMTRDELDATLIIPENFGKVAEGQTTPSGEITVLYNQNNEQGAQTLSAVLNDVFKDVNKQFVSLDQPFTVKTESTATDSQKRFDYTFSGLLGFSIMSLGIFGPTNVFPRLKSRGVLRRYSTTPLKIWQYFIAALLSNSVAGILSVASMIAVALVFFDLQMQGDIFSLTAVVVMGVIVLYGIGLSIGGWAKNENQAAPLSNLVTFPMMFLSGTFFPRYLMPEWLQGVSGYLPLTPVIDSIRLVVTEGRTLFDLGPQMGLLAVWAVVIYFVAFRVFRWE
jgi:ABC-2 type transport system permease protein